MKTFVTTHALGIFNCIIQRFYVVTSTACLTVSTSGTCNINTTAFVYLLCEEGTQSCCKLSFLVESILTCHVPSCLWRMPVSCSTVVARNVRPGCCSSVHTLFSYSFGWMLCLRWLPAIQMDTLLRQQVSTGPDPAIQQTGLVRTTTCGIIPVLLLVIAVVIAMSQRLITNQCRDKHYASSKIHQHGWC